MIRTTDELVAALNALTAVQVAPPLDAPAERPMAQTPGLFDAINEILRRNPGSVQMIARGGYLVELPTEAGPVTYAVNGPHARVLREEADGAEEPAP